MRYWKPRPIPGNPRVTIVVASYLNDDPRRLAALQCLLASLNAQTYPNWSAIVVHDGPLLPAVAARVTPMLAAVHPARIVLSATAERVQQFGHPHRHAIACQVPAEFVGFANDDGYYAPVYLEWLLSRLCDPERPCDLAHCDLVHSHRLWREFVTAPVAGKIDVGCFLARTDLVRRTPWTDHSFRGDGIYVEALARNARGVARVDKLLYVHN